MKYFMLYFLLFIQAGFLFSEDFSFLIEPQGKAEHGYCIILLSGDGGWVAIDKALYNYFTDKNIPVVGFNSLRYFSTVRTPLETTKTLAQIMESYIHSLNCQRVYLAGYSFGANVLPFCYNRFSQEERKKVAGIAMIGVSVNAQFEFHPQEWLGLNGNAPQYPILPEFKTAITEGAKIIAIGGENETDTLLPLLDTSKATVHILPGGHHFNNDYTKLGDLISQWIATFKNY